MLIAGTGRRDEANRRIRDSVLITLGRPGSGRVGRGYLEWIIPINKNERPAYVSRTGEIAASSGCDSALISVSRLPIIYRLFRRYHSTVGTFLSRLNYVPERRGWPRHCCARAHFQRAMMGNNTVFPTRVIGIYLFPQWRDRVILLIISFKHAQRSRLAFPCTLSARTISDNYIEIRAAEKFHRKTRIFFINDSDMEMLGGFMMTAARSLRHRVIINVRMQTKRFCSVLAAPRGVR